MTSAAAFGAAVSVRHSSWTLNEIFTICVWLDSLVFARQQPTEKRAMYSSPSGPNWVPITRLEFCALEVACELYGSQSWTRSISLLSLRSLTSFQKPLSAPRLLMNHEPS